MFGYNDSLSWRSIVNYAKKNGLTTCDTYEPNPFVVTHWRWIAWEVGCFVAAFNRARNAPPAERVMPMHETRWDHICHGSVNGFNPDCQCCQKSLEKTATVKIPLTMRIVAWVFIVCYYSIPVLVLSVLYWAIKSILFTH